MLDHLGSVTGSIPPDAPITLIGGGAMGTAWRDTVSRLSGREIVIPDAQELVALGAAVQAAAVLAGRQPEEIARSWNLRAGTVIAAQQRDDQALERFRAVLAATTQLNQGMVER